MLGAVLPSRPTFFLRHFTRTQESLAKSTFGRQTCQRGNGRKSLRIQENSALRFSLQRLGEVDRNRASRRDSCRTAFVRNMHPRQYSVLRLGGTVEKAVFLQVVQQQNGRVLG